LRPVEQLADLLLARPIPVLPVTYLDLIEFAAHAGQDGDTLEGLLTAINAGPSELKQTLTKVKAIGQLLDPAASSSEGTVTLAASTPSFDVRQTALSSLNLPAKTGSVKSGSLAFDNNLNQFNVQSTSGFDAEFHVDLIDDPTNVLKLLIGDPSANIASFHL